jgi:hypothetical protein
MDIRLFHRPTPGHNEKSLLCATNFNGLSLHARLFVDTATAAASEMQAIGSS